MDIKIGIDDSGVDDGLNSVEAKLDAFAKGVQSLLSFEINDDAIKRAETSLQGLANISLDSIMEELGDLADAMMKLAIPDLSQLGNTDSLDSEAVDEFTSSLARLQSGLLKTLSLYDMLDGDMMKQFSTSELTQAQNELTAYQASLHGISEALRQQWVEAEHLGLSTEELNQVQAALQSSLTSVEARMEAVDDAMENLAAAFGTLQGAADFSAAGESATSAGDAVSDAADEINRAASAAANSTEELGNSMRRAFQYDTQDAMMQRKADLEAFIEQCQQFIAQIREQMSALRLADMSTSDYVDQMRQLQEGIAAAKSAIRGYREELAYIQSQLEQAARAQDEYNNSTAQGGSNVPATSPSSSPMSPADIEWANGVREISVQLQEACAQASSFRERMEATGAAVREVVSQSVQGARQTTLWQRIVVAMRREWASIGNMVKGIVFSQMFYKFTNAISSAITELKEFRYELEETTVAYGIMLGNAEQGERLTNSLMNLAADTQLSFQQVNAATRKLTAYGFEAENLEFVLRNVADAAAAAGDPYSFDRIVLALGQINTKGKLAGQEINQLAEAGINVRKYLTEGLGITVEQLAEIQRKGIPADAAIKLILNGIAKDYGGAADKIADTMSGLAETIHDNFLIIGQDMLDPFFDAAKDIMTKVRDTMNIWRTIVVDGGFGALLETLFPKSFVDQIRLFMANMSLLRESIFNVLRALAPFIQSLIQTGLVIANTVLPVINLFLTILAKGLTIIAQNDSLIRLLTASFMGLLVAKAVSWTMTNFLTVIEGVTKGVTWAVEGLKLLGGMLVAGAGAMRTFSISTLFARLMAGDFTAAIAALIGVTTALVFSSEKASEAMTNMMGSLTKSLGHDFNKIYAPNMDKSGKITDEFNKAIGVSDESLEKLGDTAKDASKKAKNAVASFDEVFTLSKQDEDEDDLDLDLSGLDLDVPELDYDGFLDSMDDFLAEADEKNKSFWDTWLGRTLKGLGKWIWETIKGFGKWILESAAGFLKWQFDTLAGFASWCLESLARFAKWSYESLKGFAQWIGDSLAGFDEWFRDSLDGFLGWAGDSIAGFDDWFRESLDMFLDWAGESIAGFDDWFRESMDGFTTWINESLSGFDDWFRESMDGFLEWSGDSIAAFDDWFRESLNGFLDWAGDTLSSFDDWFRESQEGFSAWASDTWDTLSGWIRDSAAGFVDWASESWNSFSDWIKNSKEGLSGWAADTWDTFSGWLSDSLGGVGQWTLDTFQYFSDWSNWTVEGFTTWASDTWERLSTWFTDSKEGFLDWTGSTWEKLSTWFADSKEGFNTWTSETWEKLSLWFVDSKEGLTSWATETWASLSTWLDNSREGLSTWATNTWKTFTTWVDDTKESFGGWIDETEEKFNTWVINTRDKFTTWSSNTWKTFTDWVEDTGGKFNDWVTTSRDDFIGWADDTYTKFDTWVQDTSKRFNTWATDSYNRFTTWATDSYNKLDTWVQDSADGFDWWVKDTGKRFTDWVSDTLKKLTEWDTKSDKQLTDWVNKTVKAFGNWASDTLKAVAGWGKGLWDAIVGPLKKVWDYVNNAFKDIGKKVSDIWNGKDKVKTIEKSVAVSYSMPDDVSIAPRAIVSPIATLSAPIVPIARVSAPTAPDVDTAISRSYQKKQSSSDFSGIGKEIAEYLLPALANNTGTQEQPTPVYVGTLIADERGLRELERKMQVIRLKEGGRGK